VVQSTAILLFKLCQKDGKYTFNPASSVALTEICKLILASTLHYQSVTSSKKGFWEGVTPKIVINYFGLSLLYTINNQLSFYCLEIADPGSMALGKSIAPYLCALLLRLNGQILHALQWVCVITQCCAIAIVQCTRPAVGPRRSDLSLLPAAAAAPPRTSPTCRRSPRACSRASRTSQTMRARAPASSPRRRTI
jgi:hypothetical protein